MAGVSLNKILLVGNLTKDPELRYLPNGTPKAELRIATSRTYTTNGEKREDTCFVDVIAWSRTAENANQYLRKGSKIFVEGRLDYQEWEGQDGSKRSKHQVVADRVQFMDPPRGAAGGEQGAAGFDADLSAGGGEGAPRPSYNRNQGGANGGSPAGGGRSYGRPYGNAQANPNQGQPTAQGAPAQAESGLERPVAPLAESMGIADDDIPF
jgi:single-strand DNA-binding protein